MNKYTWYVIQCSNHVGSWAFAKRIHNTHNLVGLFSDGMGSLANIETINACDSKADAERIAAAWNKGFEERGIYNPIYTT